jgi:hypothetical protein
MAEDIREPVGDVEISTPMGTLKTRGYHLGNVLQIVAAVLLALMAMMMYEMRAETKATASIIQTATKDTIAALAVSNKSEHDSIAKALDKNSEQQEITNYIFTLSPADREKLHIRMPDALRRRIIDR